MRHRSSSSDRPERVRGERTRLHGRLARVYTDMGAHPWKQVPSFLPPVADQGVGLVSSIPRVGARRSGICRTLIITTVR